MLTLILNSFMDFRRSWRKYIGFALLYLALTSYLFVPLLSYLFNRLLIMTGSGVLLNREVFRIFLNYRSAIGVFFLAVAAVMVIVIELGTLIVISHKKYFRKTILVTEAVLTVIRSLPRLMGFGTVYLMLLLLVMIPLIELPVEPLISGRIEPPALLMENIMGSPVTRLIYWGTVIIFIYFLLRWIFALHAILLESKSSFQAIKTSIQLTHQVRLTLLIKLLIMNLLLLGAGTGVLTALSIVPRVIRIPTNYLMNQYMVTFTGFLALIFTLMLMPVNMIFLTRLYYQAMRQAGNKEEDHLETWKIPWMEQAEAVIDRLFRRRRTILGLILILTLLVTFYTGLALNQDLLYIGRRVSIVAHRGDVIHTPENSLSAIRSAMETGADVIEFDVQMTRDQEVVLHHDLTLSRMAGINARVEDLTYEELLELDIGSRFSSNFEGERIPTLKEALDLIQGQAEVLIDVKVYGSAEEMARTIVRNVEEAHMVELSYIQSFDYNVLQEVRKLNPDIRIGQIMYHALGNLSRLDVDFYTIQKGMLNRDLVREARRLDRGVWVWTVNREEEIKEVLQYDIDGIITNHVTLAREILGVEPAPSLETDE